MNNQPKLSKEQLQALADKFSNGKSIDKNALQKALNGGNANEFLKSTLTKEQTEKLNKVLSDENAVKKLLNSEQAKKLMKMFTGEQNNGR